MSWADSSWCTVDFSGSSSSQYIIGSIRTAYELSNTVRSADSFKDGPVDAYIKKGMSRYAGAHLKIPWIGKALLMKAVLYFPHR